MPTPVRTCVGCRRTDEKLRLVRVVWDGEANGIAADLDGLLPGRGAYIHAGCADAALKRHGFSRALRRPVDAAQAAEALGTLGVTRAD